MTLGDIVKRYRSDNHLSMDDFARLSGLSKGYISMLERNEKLLRLFYFHLNPKQAVY